MPGILELLAEQRLAAAVAEGEFDRLPGAGKPLRLEDDGLVPQEWRAALWVLKRSGFRPAWIESRREIQQAASRARARLKGASAADPGRSAAEARFRDEARAINRRVGELNLGVPAARWQLRQLDPDAEIALLASWPDDDAAAG